MEGLQVALAQPDLELRLQVSAIYSKLDASSRTEAVRLGVRLGLIVL